MPRARCVATEGTKTCKDCHVEKSVLQFRVHQNYLDGRFTRCRTCQKDRDSQTAAERAMQNAQLSEPRWYWDGYRVRCKRCQGSKIYSELNDIWCLDCTMIITTFNQPLPMVMTKIRLLAEESRRLRIVS